MARRPQRRNKRSSKRPIRRNNNEIQLRETKPRSTSYTGPIDTPAFRTACDVHTFVLRLSGGVTSTAGGVIATVFDSWSQAGTTSQWASLTAMFSEVRILAFKLHMIPVNKFSTSVNNIPITSVVTRDTATALTSFQDAAGYVSSQEHGTFSTINRVVRMDDLDEASWIQMSSSPASNNRLYVKLYGSGLAASTNYYQFLNSIVVQFRGFQ